MTPGGENMQSPLPACVRTYGSGRLAAPEPETIMLRASATILIALLLTGPAWAGDEPSSEDDKQADLEALTEVISRAELVADAVSAYNAANAVERGNIAVNLAYMKKMLTFGKVDYAVYAARWVLSAEPDNALALSVIGYCDATSGDVESALPGIVRALEQLPDDESLLADAGQLLAWLDVQEELLSWPEDIERIIAANRGEWDAQADFRQAYDDAAAVLGQFEEAIFAAGDAAEEIRRVGLAIEDEIAVLTERLEPIDAEIYSLQVELAYVEAELDGTYRNAAQLRRRINNANARIAELEAKSPRTPAEELELARLRSDVVSYRQALRARRGRRDRHQLRQRADELRDMIRDNQRERDEIVVYMRGLHREMRDAKDDLDQAEAELVVLQSDRRKMIRGIGRLLEWRLPAIDGVVIDVVAAGEDYVARTNPPARALSDEANAAGKLRLARKYIEIDKPEMAIRYLQLLLETFPESEVADEARKLLERLHRQAEGAT